jgi:flagellar basal body-associated protein FliL
MKKIGLILGLLNTVAIAAVLGLFVYTQVIFKRPPITESKERAKLVKKAEAPVVVDRSKTVMVPLDAVTVNLDAYTGADGKPKTHVVSMNLALEIVNEKAREKVDSAKPALLDRIIQNLGKRRFEELNQVQGRYVFKSQVIDDSNDYLKAPVVVEVFMTDFMLQ